jgi:hypothetical protein
VKLNKDDLLKVLAALANASVVSDPGDKQIVRNGSPADIQAAVKALGKKSISKNYTKETLSTGVELVSKPSKLPVSPWQMVSALLGGAPLRTATWWAAPKIYSTTDDSTPGCWDSGLQNPEPVEVATTGQWGARSSGSPAEVVQTSTMRSSASRCRVALTTQSLEI